MKCIKVLLNKLINLTIVHIIKKIKLFYLTIKIKQNLNNNKNLNQNYKNKKFSMIYQMIFKMNQRMINLFYKQMK